MNIAQIEPQIKRAMLLRYIDAFSKTEICESKVETIKSAASRAQNPRQRHALKQSLNIALSQHHAQEQYRWMLHEKLHRVFGPGVYQVMDDRHHSHLVIVPDGHLAYSLVRFNKFSPHALLVAG